MKRWVAAVDIGGTKIEVALIDERGQIGERKRWQTPLDHDVAAVEAGLVETIQALQKEAGVVPIGVGIGMAGQIDHETGMVLFAPNLQWRNVPLQADLQEKLQLPVSVSGDVQLATLGEWRLGAGKGCRDMVCLCVGTGVGGGIVSNGQLVHGHLNCAGEIGHMTIDVHGPQCTCGNAGCLEAFAGGWAIALRAKEALQRDPSQGQKLLKLAQGSIEKITAQTVEEAAAAGDVLSRRILNDAVEALGAGCASIVNALNPERLILGGGVLLGQPALIDQIEIEIRKRALAAACQKLRILPAKLGKDAGLVGAACWVFEKS
jgi:glucokinase